MFGAFVLCIMDDSDVCSSVCTVHVSDGYWMIVMFAVVYVRCMCLMVIGC